MGDIQVDVLEVADSDLARLPQDPTGRLYVLAHAWAADTATRMIIRAEHLDEVQARVAEPGPLIAMKLQSTIDRGAAKEGTDLLDIIRLALDRHAGPIARSQLSQADEQLRTAISLACGLVFSTTRREIADPCPEDSRGRGHTNR
jgi:hypothetical protein